MMKRIEAVLRVERLRSVKEHLHKEIGIGGMVIHVLAWYKEIKLQLRYRGLPVAYDLLPAAKFELFVQDDKIDSVIKTIKEHARTGEAGDGYIIVSDVDQAIEISALDEVGNELS